MTAATSNDPASTHGGHGLHLPANIVELPLQHLDLFLLAKHRPVQGVHQILGKRQLDLEFLDAPFNFSFHSSIPFQ